METMLTDEAPLSDLAPVVEGPVAATRELEALLKGREIPVVLAAKPTSSCCGGGGCGCGAKLQVLVHREDIPRVMQILEESWLDSVRREGVIGDDALVSLRSSQSDPGVEACPACGHAGARTEGACSDCGLQLE
jgi:hypothetical protein